MNYEELLCKYNILLRENQKLQDEITALKEQLGISELALEASLPAEKSVMTQFLLDNTEVDTSENEQPVTCSKYSDPTEKIQLFRLLFRGREDVYAKRWENKKGASGYSPVCSNEWQTGLCQKPKGKCSDCTNKDYVPLNDDIIDEHLRGKMVAGIYPLLPDECCWFLAFDFDDKDWQKKVYINR